MIPDAQGGQRLDQALSAMLPEFSRNRIQNWIRARKIAVDDAWGTTKMKVSGGESVRVEIEPDPNATPDAPEAIPLDVVFEDPMLLVINKPVGLVVHPGSGNRHGTLLNALLHLVPQVADLPRAGIVHRLDKDTSGLLVVAKTLKSHTDLVRQLQARTVKREYLALVYGEVDKAAPSMRRWHAIRITAPSARAQHGQGSSYPLRGGRALSRRERCCAASWKPAAPTRSGCTCSTSATRWSASRSIAPAAAATTRFRFRARRCTPSGWG